MSAVVWAWPSGFFGLVLGGNLYATTLWPASIGTGEGGAESSLGIGLTQNPHLKPEWRKAPVARSQCAWRHGGCA
jgi:hypothetical protein